MVLLRKISTTHTLSRTTLCCKAHSVGLYWPTGGSACKATMQQGLAALWNLSLHQSASRVCFRHHLAVHVRKCGSDSQSWDSWRAAGMQQQVQTCSTLQGVGVHKIDTTPACGMLASVVGCLLCELDVVQHLRAAVSSSCSTAFVAAQAEPSVRCSLQTSALSMLTSHAIQLSCLPQWDRQSLKVPWSPLAH